MAKNWWEDAPLVEPKSDEWWKAAPLAKTEAAAPAAPSKTVLPDSDTSSDFMRGMANYPGSLQETYGGAKALAGIGLSKLGATETGRSLLASGVESMNAGETKQVSRESDSFTKAWEKGIGTVVTDWLPYQIGSGVANIGETLAFMGLGAGLGAVTGAGVGAAPGAVAGAVSKSLIKKGIKEAAEALVETETKKAIAEGATKQAAKVAGETAGRKFVEEEAKNVVLEASAAAAKEYGKAGAKAYGKTAGMVGQAGLHGAGEVTSRAIQEAEQRGMSPEDIDLTRVLPAAVAHSVADFFINKIGLDSMKIGETASKSLIADITKRIGVTGLKEIPAEEIQTIAERYGAELSLADAEALREYVDTAAAAFGMSVGPGGVGGARTHFAKKFADLSKEAGTTGDLGKTIEELRKASTSAAEDINTPKAPLTADNLALLNPATDADGKAFTTVSSDTAEAQGRVDEEAAQVQLTKDQVIQKAQDYVASIDAGGKPNRDIINELGKNLGVKFPQAIKSNVAKLNLIKQHLAQQGAPSAATTGTVAGPAGAGAAVATLAPTDDPSAGAEPSGVVPPATVAQPATGGKTVQPAPLTPNTAAQQDEDLLNSILGGGASSLSARRTNAQIEEDEKVAATLKELGQRYGLTRDKNESVEAFGARIRKALPFEKKRLEQEAGAPILSNMSMQDLAGQEQKQEKPYEPDKEQIEAYEENREYYNENLKENDTPLPAYKELSPEERIIYFKNNIPLGTRDVGYRGTAAQHSKALEELAAYHEAKLEEGKPKQAIGREKTNSKGLPRPDFGQPLFDESGAPIMTSGPLPGETRARTTYTEIRDEFSRKTGLAYSFPQWTALSRASQKLFIEINKPDTIMSRDMAFRALKGKIQAEKAEDALKEQSLSDKARMQQRIMDIQEQNEIREEDRLPENIISALLGGDIKKVLDYIRENGNGIGLKFITEYNLVAAKKDKTGVLRPRFKKGRRPIRDSIAMGMFRNLAARLLDVEGLQINVVFDENLVFNERARYDARTNTMYIGPNGLDEATILHELTHAATVKIIHQFFTDPSKLSPRARMAVEHLINIAATAKARLGSKYPSKAHPYDPFENLYEFVAYAMTDVDFQNDLAQIQVPRLTSATAKSEEQSKEMQLERESKQGAGMYNGFMDNLWNSFTGTLAYMYKLFTPNAKNTTLLVPTDTTRPTAAKTAKGALREKAKEEIGAKRISDDEKETKGLTKEEKAKLTSAEKEAFAPEALFNDPEAEMKEAVIPPLKGELVIQRGVANLRRATLSEPGYKGNLLLEAAEMFQLILEAPPEGGIERLAGKEGLDAVLYSATAAPAAPTAPTKKEKPTPELRDGDLNADNPDYDPSAKEMPTGMKRLRALLTTHAGHKRLASIFQNDRYAIKEWENIRDMSKQIYREGKDKINNIYEQIILATGDARNLYNKHVKEAAEEMDRAVGDFTRKSGLPSTEKALNKLHMIVEALHSPERRLVKYLLTVPLSDKKVLNGGTISPADRRAQIKTALDTLNLSKAQAQQLRTELDAIVAKYTDPYGKSPKEFSPIDPKSPNAANDAALRVDMNSIEYNATGLTLDATKRITAQYEKHPQKAEIDRVIAALRTLNTATADLNKIANYWSQPVSNRVAFYGFENYVPLKGNPHHTTVDEELDFDSAKNGREAQDSQGSMDGRISVSNNPILQTMSDATRAAMRAGRRNVTQAIKNSLDYDKEKNPNGQGILKGRVAKTIKFEERDSVDLKEYKGETTIFHYNEDGSIDILVVADKKLRDAIRRTYKQTKPVVDIANKMTSTVGQFHTRYNYQFAPLNFVRDALTNAFTIGAELGPVEAARFIKNVSTMVVAKNGLYKAMQVALLYENGDAQSMAALQKLADKDPFVRDMVEYVKTGGMVSYLQGMSLKSNFQSLKKEVGRSGMLRTKEQLEKYVDVWTDMFELASRTAAYQIVKQNAIAKKESPRAATVRAVAYVKNLANFEQVGELGKAMGAFYMFFRPAATGAVRAIEAVAPAFTPLSVALERLPPDITGEAKENYKRAYAQKQQSARIMTASLVGLGMMAYAMAQMGADDDDLGRNAVATDNMQQWTRFARFHIPKKLSTAMGMGEDVVFQVPWGFGLGAFAASGAQIAATAAGAQSFKDMAQNIFLQISLDSFVPIPVSRMPPLEMPLEFVLDSIAPSLARPVLEFALNKNGLGQDIYNDQNRRFGDAYTGGDKIPEMYKQASRYMADATKGEIDISPNTLYFLSNSYIDGIGRVVEGLHGISDLASGNKQFNPKTDVPLFGSFFGSKSNVDSREFSNVEKKVQDMERKIKMFESNPEIAAGYDAKHPLNRMIVDYYNKQVNNELKDLRSQAKQVRLQQGYTPKERSEILKVITYQQNIVKYQMLQMFKAYGVEPN